MSAACDALRESWVATELVKQRFNAGRGAESFAGTTWS